MFIEVLFMTFLLLPTRLGMNSDVSQTIYNSYDGIQSSLEFTGTLESGEHFLPPELVSSILGLADDESIMPLAFVSKSFYKLCIESAEFPEKLIKYIVERKGQHRNILRYLRDVTEYKFTFEEAYDLFNKDWYVIKNRILPELPYCILAMFRQHPELSASLEFGFDKHDIRVAADYLRLRVIASLQMNCSLSGFLDSEMIEAYHLFYHPIIFNHLFWDPEFKKCLLSFNQPSLLPQIEEFCFKGLENVSHNFFPRCVSTMLEKAKTGELDHHSLLFNLNAALGLTWNSLKSEDTKAVSELLDFEPRFKGLKDLAGDHVKIYFLSYFDLASIGTRAVLTLSRDKFYEKARNVLLFMHENSLPFIGQGFKPLFYFRSELCLTDEILRDNARLLKAYFDVKDGYVTSYDKMDKAVIYRECLKMSRPTIVKFRSEQPNLVKEIIPLHWILTEPALPLLGIYLRLASTSVDVIKAFIPIYRKNPKLFMGKYLYNLVLHFIDTGDMDSLILCKFCFNLLKDIPKSYQAKLGKLIMQRSLSSEFFGIEFDKLRPRKFKSSFTWKIFLNYGFHKKLDPKMISALNQYRCWVNHETDIFGLYMKYHSISPLSQETVRQYSHNLPCKLKIYSQDIEKLYEDYVERGIEHVNILHYELRDQLTNVFYVEKSTRCLELLIERDLPISYISSTFIYFIGRVDEETAERYCLKHYEMDLEAFKSHFSDEWNCMEYNFRLLKLEKVYCTTAQFECAFDHHLKGEASEDIILMESESIGMSLSESTSGNVQANLPLSGSNDPSQSSLSNSSSESSSSSDDCHHSKTDLYTSSSSSRSLEDTASSSLSDDNSGTFVNHGGTYESGTASGTLDSFSKTNAQTDHEQKEIVENISTQLPSSTLTSESLDAKTLLDNPSYQPPVSPAFVTNVKNSDIRGSSIPGSNSRTGLDTNSLASSQSAISEEPVLQHDLNYNLSFLAEFINILLMSLSTLTIILVIINFAI